VFRRWLTGAAVEKHIELGIELPMLCRDSLMWLQITGQLTYNIHPTRLHAALAALERHAKEKSNG
jgi:hypothetical protein